LALISLIIVLPSCSAVPNTTEADNELTNTPTPTATSAPTQIGSDFSPGNIIEKIAPSVVTILTEWVDYSYFLQPVPYTGAASGIIFRSDGFIATNNHVVENAKTITVILQDGRILQGSLWGADPFTDVAVVKVEASNLSTATLGNSKSLKLGDEVIAVGNAFDLPGGHTVTSGIVSALGRSIKLSGGIILHDLIQTDAAINPGNSGGPLVNQKGEVVGINTAIVGGAENIGFAVSTNTAKPILEELVRNRMLTWPWLGVAAIDLTPAIAFELNVSSKEGVLIDEVYSNSPASRAGLRKNDVINKINGQIITSFAELEEIIRKCGIGKSIDVDFIRAGNGQVAKVTLEQIPRQF
jgi:serine protease Do